MPLEDEEGQAQGMPWDRLTGTELRPLLFLFSLGTTFSLSFFLPPTSTLPLLPPNPK